MPIKSEGNVVVFGYLINESVLFHISKDNLININGKKASNVSSYSYLRETMSRLLLYLLENCTRENISIEDILFNVWDRYDLQSSKPRLWQVMKTLKINLISIGVSEDFITQEIGGFYTVRSEFVRVLYCLDSIGNNASSDGSVSDEIDNSYLLINKNSHR